WFTSIPSITPTTLLVAGSMICTLSPALLVWMMRIFFPSLSAARGAGALNAIAAAIARPRRSASVFVIVRSSSVRQSTLSASATRDRSATPSACPRCERNRRLPARRAGGRAACSSRCRAAPRASPRRSSCATAPRSTSTRPRSEEHTSELQSLRHLVCRLLLEKTNSVRHGPHALRGGRAHHLSALREHQAAAQRAQPAGRRQQHCYHYLAQSRPDHVPRLAHRH